MKITFNSRHDLAFRRAIISAGVIGTLLFGLLFAVSWLYPTVLEAWARQAIAQEVQERVETELDGLSDSAIGRAAGRMIDKNNLEKAEARAQMARKLPSLVSVVITSMLDPDCPCRSQQKDPARLAKLVGRAKQSENETLRASIGKLDEANAKLTGLIESKYRNVAGSLLREVRIFSGANAAVFLLLAIIAAVWRRSAMQLLAPAIVLIGAAAITAMTYLFNQNWLQTILLNDYVGLLYLPYLGIALAFMLDVVFNRARVSLQLVAAVASMIGGVLSVC